jgi:prepilin-type N-terminal cleavage/methylation domain-containing protein
MIRFRAFTLVELLVVIAVLAILVSLLFPMIMRSREGARRITCFNNQQQLGQALNLYVDAFDAKLPMAANLEMPATNPLRMWPSQVFPYVQDKKVFACPSSDSRVAFTWADRSWQNVGYSGVTAYDPNGCEDNVPDPRGCEGFKRVISLTELKEPARVALFADTPAGELQAKYRGYVFSPYNGIVNPRYPELSPPLCSDRDLVRELSHLPPSHLKPIYARHQADGEDNGFVSIVFADGHAKAFTARSVLAMENGANIIWRFR